MTEAEKHFNKIARDYDYWKQKNSYYYENLINLYRSLIPRSSSVLEIGCGTGDIISQLDVREGKAVDLSYEMIEIARKKHADKKNILFAREDIHQTDQLFSSKYIFLADVLEHVDDVPSFLKQLSKRTLSSSKVIITLANPMWEPILMLAEKMKMKMPEGPHYRHPISKLEKIFKEAGFNIQEKGYRLLIPKKMFFSDWINQRFYKSKILRNFGFTVYWIITK